LVPSETCVDLSGPIHTESLYGCSASWRATDHFSTFSIDSKMQIPGVATWMKQSDFGLTFFVVASFKV